MQNVYNSASQGPPLQPSATLSHPLPIITRFSYEEAMEWCERRQVTVSFVRIHGRPRVQVRFGPAIIVERDTLLQAVEGANAIEERQPK